jgi:hypothetical protein
MLSKKLIKQAPINIFIRFMRACFIKIYANAQRVFCKYSAAVFLNQPRPTSNCARNAN